MDLLQFAGVGLALLGTLCLGTIAHEYAHLVALRALGVECELTWLENRDAAGALRASLLGTWASVAPRELPPDVSIPGLRAAALMPFSLALPFLLVPLGFLPDPVATGNPYAVAGAVAWLGCALPSPQDFSVAWHARRVVDAELALEG